MAISDSYNWSMSRNDLIQDGYEEATILGEGETLSAEQITKGARKLNQIIQQWASSADYSPGFKVWARKRAYLFLQSGQVKYLLGDASTDDNYTYSYVTTTGTAIEPTSETSIAVDSITGISSGDYFGIELADGTIHWDVVNGAPSGSTVVLTTGLASASKVGSQIFTYTTKAPRPQRVLQVTRRNTNGEDTPLSEIVDWADYESIEDKDSIGTPTQYHPEPQTSNVNLFLDQAPADVTDVIRLTVRRPLSDFDASSDTPDFPKIWYRPLSLQLAVDLCRSNGVTVSQDLKDALNEALTFAKSEYPQDTVTFFEPDRVE